jgi:protein tyrosine phosphatase
VDGSLDLADLRSHAGPYSKKISRFYAHPESSNESEIRVASELQAAESVRQVVNRIQSKLGLFEVCKLVNDTLEVRLSRKLVESEARFLKSNGVQKIIGLTEKDLASQYWGNDFEIQHLPIEDVGAPTLALVDRVAHEFAKSRGPIALHCLAGLGRTSTVILAAYRRLGENLDSLLAEIRATNPTFVLAGDQEQFLRSL